MAPLKAVRRFTQHKRTGNPLTLRQDHPAAIGARTMFMANVVGSAAQLRLLKSGANSVKIGSHVTKGELAGAPIFTLTLEERATCPRSCAHWLDCYGNKMHWPKRITADDGLTRRLEGELWVLSMRHPGGFMVRLHVLGDFYSVEYVQFWQQMLAKYEALNVYGYTARRGCEIATAIEALSEHPRCHLRLSDGDAGEYRTVTVESEVGAFEQEAILCPAQTDKTDCCGTCALCWSTPKTIAFLRH